MAWRGVHLTEPGFLSYERNSLKIKRDDAETVTVPLEDLGWLIIDTDQATLTSRLLSECAENDVCVLFSDSRHHPSAFIIPRFGYHRQLTTVKAQTGMGKHLKGKLWKKIVERKILNQSAALDAAAHDPERLPTVKALDKMAGRVRNGDPDNIEALAAQVYWPKIFPGIIRRDDNDTRNARLNYGYAIVRALIARELAALGFELSFGLHHANTLNAFNLADDLLEPFRPLVDAFVYKNFDHDAVREDFTTEDRRFLVSIPQLQVGLGGDALSFLAAARQCAAGLRIAVVDNFPQALILPVPSGGCETSGQG